MRVGVGGALCASLLAACADGRGSNGFKSYQYSKEQMATNKAKEDAKLNALKNSNIPVNAIPANNDTQQAQPVSGGDTGKQAAVSQEAADSIEYQQIQDAAKAKEMTEMGQAAVQTSASALRVSNDLAVASNKEVPALKNLVKGVTVTSNMAGKQLLLNIDAVVVVDGADHTLSVQNAPLGFMKDGVTTALPFRLLKGTEAVIPGKKLIVTAICKEESCQSIQIRFEFEGRPGVVVGYKLVGTEWQLMESNIGEVAAFDKGQESGQGEDPLAKAKAAEAAKNNGQNLTDEQKAALELQKSVDAAKKLEEERAKAGQGNAEQDKTATDKKASEAVAYAAAFGEYQALMDKRVVDPAQAQAEKKASEEKASQAAATAALYGEYQALMDKTVVDPAQAQKASEEKEAPAP
jgi:hypothetical protein